MVVNSSQEIKKYLKEKSMIRNIVIIVSAVIISFMLLGIGSFILLKITPMGEFVESYSQTKLDNLSHEQIEQIKKKYGDSLELTIAFVQHLDIIIFLISLLVGIFIGFLVKNKIWLISVVSFMPLVFVSLLANSWSLKQIFLSVAYIFLVGISARFVSNFKRKRYTGQA